MKRNLLSFVFKTLLIFVPLASCVTVNIYFPAEEVKNAADQVVGDVWDSAPGERPEADKPAPTAAPLSELFGVSTAYAEQNIKVSTPEIVAIKNSMRARFPELNSYLTGGALGVGADGYLKIHDASALPAQDRAALNSLLAAENQDRNRLYREIAKANGFPNQWKEVEAIFAKTWLERAHAGWYVERGKSWEKK